MFFVTPVLPILGIYILAAILPAVILLRYVYRHDTIEKEPVGLLLRLLLIGVVAAICSGILEGVAQAILNFFLDQGSLLYTILLAFVAVAAIEEGMKFCLLKRQSWWHPAFNYRFDGIVYAVFVSLGFAAYENILYVFQYGLSVAFPRALLAIPGHMSFAVCMGIFYGRAKFSWNSGDEAGARWNQWVGYLYALFLHGFYDACAMLGTTGSMIVFLLFVGIMFWTVYRLLKRESALDGPISY